MPDSSRQRLGVNRNQASKRVWATLALVAAVPLLLASQGASASGVTDLGRLTNDTSYAGPLGLFRYTKTSLWQGPKPELLFLGVQMFPTVEAERWPLIKALSQFGSFTGVTAFPNMSHTAYPTFPSFDLDHMVYHSRYLAFVSKDLLRVGPDPGPVGIRLSPFRELTRTERKLFDRYANPMGPRANLYAAASRAVSIPGSKSLPLLVIGGYSQTSPTNPVTQADFQVVHPQPTACPQAIDVCTSPLRSFQRFPYPSAPELGLW